MSCNNPFYPRSIRAIREYFNLASEDDDDAALLLPVRPNEIYLKLIEDSSWMVNWVFEAKFSLGVEKNGS